MKALRNAFAKMPVRVEAASAHTSKFPYETIADQEHIVGVLGGWSGGTGELLDLVHSAVYYWPILNNAQIAIGYPEGQGPNCGVVDWCAIRPTYPPATATDVTTFQKLMAAFGTGIGNSAAHELGHQFQAGKPTLQYMDCGHELIGLGA
jgi:hypothetical protein